MNGATLRVGRLILVGAWVCGSCLPASGRPAATAATRPVPAGGERTPLVVFAAGSLILPFQALEEAFEDAHPQMDVRPEYHGSIQVIRHATELQEPIDVVATADASLIPMLMFEAVDPRTGQPYADWACRFAGNRLAVAATDRSRHVDEIDSYNWAEILARPDVILGLADPRFDASGYRALMAFALAERQAASYGLFDDMFGGQFTYPVTIFRDDDLSTMSVPEVLETRSDSHLRLRGGSIQLLALLESGDIDYAFEYESVIRQHGLRMIELPAEVSLGEPANSPGYRRVEVQLDFHRFATVDPRFRGEPIAYGVTIPSSAPHPEAAAEFVAFLLGPQGRSVMEDNFHPLLARPVAANGDRMPSLIRPLCDDSEGS